MTRIVKIKNLQDSADTYEGQEIQSGAYYTLEPDEVTSLKYANSAKVQNHLSSTPAKILINDGTSDLAYLAGKNHLEGNDPKDSSGYPVFKQKLVNTDDRPIIHSTMRRVGTYTYICSDGDDSSDPEAIGGGNEIMVDHKTGDSTTQTVYYDVNAVLNETYIQGAFVQWDNAKFDCFECEVCCQSSASAISSGTDTNYEVVSGVLIMVPGTGTKTVPDWGLIKPVEMVPNEFGVIPAGYWDVDYNASTSSFENYTFRADGSGRYNIFNQEVEFHCFIPCFTVIGNKSYHCEPTDCSQLGHNMRIKTIVKTRGTDHDWQFCAAIKLFRKYTV